MKNLSFNAKTFSKPTPNMVKTYYEQGVIVLEDMISVADCEALMTRMGELVDDFIPDDNHTTFSTLSKAQENEDYFLSSGDKIRFFFEDGAFDENGNLVHDIHSSLNKAGHAMHDKDEVFSRISRQPRLKELAYGLGLRDPKILQSMYIFKPPKIGGEVICHQDAPYLWTEPQSCTGFWIALEDATLENGCLQGIPGLHKEPMPRQQLSRILAEDGSHYTNATKNIIFDERPWPEETRVALEVKQGTLIAFHGQFPHLSGPNTSDKSRHAYTLHLIDGASEYPAFNWLQRPADDPITGF